MLSAVFLNLMSSESSPVVLSSMALLSVFSERDSRTDAFCESLSSSELAILRSEDARFSAGNC